MKLNKITEVFTKLEKTNSRLEMTDILAELLKSVNDSNELKIIVNLVQGQLDSEKLGIAEAMIIDSLVPISGYSKEYIKKIVVKHGDVGSAAEEVLSDKKQYSLFKATKPLELSVFYNRMRKLADIKSYKAKIKELSGIFTNVTPADAKFVARLVMGILRLGVATATILDSMAVGISGKKADKVIIEEAYNLSSDIGEVAVKLKEEGIEAVAATDASYGTPIRPMLASRAKYNEIMDKMGKRCFAEYKLDGERVQIHVTSRPTSTSDVFIKDVQLFSRKLNDITDQYPDIVEIVKQSIRARECILDGEIVGFKDGKMIPFQVLMKRKRKHDIKSVMKEVPVKLYLFDILRLGDKTKLHTPYMLRRDILAGLFTDDETIELVKQQQIGNQTELVGFFEQARTLGYEGIIAKRDIGQYEAGNRGANWIKLKGLEGAKMLDSVDVVIIGGYLGRGKRKGMAGSFMTAIYNKEMLRYEAFVNIGSGFTDEKIVELSALTKQLIIPNPAANVYTLEAPEVWIIPKIVLELIADEITFKNGQFYSLRFPVLRSIRTDKAPEQATTLKEIKSMYAKQSQ